MLKRFVPLCCVLCDWQRFCICLCFLTSFFFPNAPCCQVDEEVYFILLLFCLFHVAYLVKPQSAMSQRMFRLWELCSIWLCLCATRYAVARVGEDNKWSAIGIWDSRYGIDSLSADNQTVADREDAVVNLNFILAQRCWQRQCGAFSVTSATAVWNTPSLACILDDAALCVPNGVETIGSFMLH